MKVVILAAGKGTRMRPLTYKVPKPLIKVNNHPFLYYILKNLNDAGFEYQDIGIIVGYKKEKIKEWLKENEFPITLIEQREQLGTGHAVLQAKKFVGNENFLVLMADNLYSPEDLKNMVRNDNYCYIAGTEHENPKNFGVLVVKNGIVKEVLEKPQNPPTNIVNCALYKFTPEIFDAIEKTPKNKDRNEYEITDAVNLLCKEGKVRFTKIVGYWLDMGRLSDLPNVREFIMKNFD